MACNCDPFSSHRCRRPWRDAAEVIWLLAKVLAPIAACVYFGWALVRGWTMIDAIHRVPPWVFWPMFAIVVLPALKDRVVGLWRG